MLILGAGDGLALREVLTYPTESVTLVELDPVIIPARTDRLAPDQTQSRFNDRFPCPRDRCRCIQLAADHRREVRRDHRRPARPDETATAKLYSTEFYALVAAHLAPGGVVTVQAGSPYFAPRSFWCIGATLADAGLTVLPYHVDVPSFGDWGFFLAARTKPTLRMAPVAPTRFSPTTSSVPPKSSRATVRRFSYRRRR